MVLRMYRRVVAARCAICPRRKERQRSVDRGMPSSSACGGSAEAMWRGCGSDDCVEAVYVARLLVTDASTTGAQRGHESKQRADQHRSTLRSPDVTKARINSDQLTSIPCPACRSYNLSDRTVHKPNWTGAGHSGAKCDK